jgi:CheY-like chemotaxis protein
MMGGDITVESSPGRGSIFTITLPLLVESPRPTSSPSSPTPVEVQALTPSPLVLVIDDDPATRDLMRQFLGKEGFRVATASGGLEGLARARELHPDVITLDVMMPEVDGWAVLSALKADEAMADIPVILLTIIDNQNLGYALGAADYLSKPIDWDRLSALLQKYRLDRAHCSVLVVEDDTATRHLLRRMLEKQGWSVREAENGRTALEEIATHLPELILLDLMMPEMDGFAFVIELRKQAAWRSIPVIVLTAKSIGAEDRLRLNNYVERIMQKGTYSREELLAEVRERIAATVGAQVPAFAITQGNTTRE